MSKTVTFVTSGQPSANPRLLKEAITLFELGFKVNVLYSPISLWADCFDEMLFKSYPLINWIKCGVSKRENFIIYQFIRCRRKFWEIFFKLFGDFNDAAIKSLVLYSQDLLNQSFRIQSDLYIGHNLGSLMAITKASEKYGVNHIFDFEDYHRGEYLSDDSERRKIEIIECKFINKTKFATGSSPLVVRKYRELFPRLKISVIHNCFPVSYSCNNLKIIAQSPIKIFWFSQYLGTNRGIENVINAISCLPAGSFSLTLLGYASNKLKQYFCDLWENLGLNHSDFQLLDPIEEKSLVSVASDFHIGLASEVPYIENREFCLTNKVFIYLLAGNAILYSNTPSQALFLEANPLHGQVYDSDSIESIKTCLESYLNSPALLFSHRENSLKLGLEVYNWNNEKQRYISLIQNILQ